MRTVECVSGTRFPETINETERAKRSWLARLRLARGRRLRQAVLAALVAGVVAIADWPVVEAQSSTASPAPAITSAPVLPDPSKPSARKREGKKARKGRVTPLALPVTATYTVDDTSDLVDAAPGNGVCRTVANTCTLRAAVMEANATGGAQAIVLPAGVFLFTRPETGGLNASDGDLDIQQDLVITGASQAGTIVDAAGLDRIFDVQSGVTMELSLATLRNGNAGANSGGAIRSSGTLTLDHVTLTGNQVSTADGGAIRSSGTLSVRRSAFGTNSTVTGDGGGADVSGTATFEDCSFAGNHVTTGDGGAIRSSGALAIRRCTFSDNRVVNGSGGALDAAGTSAIEDTSFVGNHVPGGSGGAIHLSGSSLHNIVRSAIYGNSAQVRGGGIEASAPLSLTNTTISGNSAGGDGGGVFTWDPSTLVNVTIVNNVAASGGGINSSFDPATLRNTIVANNQAPDGPNCDGGDIVSAGGNIDSGASCGFGASDRSNMNPNLAGLALNGGFTPTHALLPGSPAIDGGVNAGCPGDDQRGYLRPRDGNGDGNAGCDSGAFEAVSSPPPTCTPRPPVGVSVAPAAPGRLQAVITANGDNNEFRSLQLTAVANASVEVGGQLVPPGGQPGSIPPGTRQVVMTVIRTIPGIASTVQLLVTDGCGAWPTLVGGGPFAF